MGALLGWPLGGRLADLRPDNRKPLQRPGSCEEEGVPYALDRPLPVECFLRPVGDPIELPLPDSETGCPGREALTRSMPFDDIGRRTMLKSLDDSGM